MSRPRASNNGTFVEYWTGLKPSYRRSTEIAADVIRLTPRRLFPIWDPYRLHRCATCEHAYWSTRATECPHP